MTFSIEGVEVGGNNTCRFVCEMSNAHGGSLDRAIRIIDAAKATGAEFIKMQCFSPDELVALRGEGPAPEPWGSQGWTIRDLYARARTPFHWFAPMFKYARKIGIVPFASFFGSESFAVLQSVDCPAYKLASLDRGHDWLRTLARSSGKPVIASVPEALEANLGYNTLHYLRCPPGYPQAQPELSYWDFNSDDYMGDPAPFVGFSYHGTDRRVPLAAATLGAKLLEFHFHLETEPSALESNVSLTEDQTTMLIEDVRAMESAMYRP